jgi:hypothetical protein
VSGCGCGCGGREGGDLQKKNDAHVHAQSHLKPKSRPPTSLLAFVFCLLLFAICYLSVVTAGCGAGNVWECVCRSCLSCSRPSKKKSVYRNRRKKNCASAGAERPEGGLCAGPAFVATPQAKKKKKKKKDTWPSCRKQEVTTSVLCECGSGSPRMRDLRGPCLFINPPGKKKKKKKKDRKKLLLNLRADRQGCWLTRFDAELRLTMLMALYLCY